LGRGRGLVAGRPRGRQKEAPAITPPGLENAMRVVLVRRGATRGAYPDRGGGAMAGGGSSIAWACAGIGEGEGYMENTTSELPPVPS